MTNYEWYAQLAKPSWAPPGWLFGPVWTVLYAIILVTFGYVTWLAYKRKIKPLVLLPFALNLVFNLIFTPIQFGLQSNVLAAVDILLVLGTLGWAMVSVWPNKKLRWVALANVPYLLWVCFATVLQLTVTGMNWGV